MVIVGPGRMGLALGAALLNRDALDRLTYMGRSLEPPPHPLFDQPQDAREEPGAPEGRAAEGRTPAGAGYRMLPAAVPEDTTIVLLAVPDRALAEVAHDLAQATPAVNGCAVLHLSGAISTDVLAPLHTAGYVTGSIHPLQAVADAWQSGERLAGAAFSISGEPAALSAARRIVQALDGLPLLVPAVNRPLYHAAAVIVSNYTVALLNAGARLLVEAGVPENDAVPALLPLLRGTAANIEQLGIPSALTGPIARGDVDTVRLHLARLSGRDRVLYCALGLEMLYLARAAGLEAGRAEEIESLLTVD